MDVIAKADILIEEETHQLVMVFKDSSYPTFVPMLPNMGNRTVLSIPTLVVF